jgi:hypothetical protein
MTDKVIRIPIIVLNIFWWDLEDLLLEKIGWLKHEERENGESIHKKLK